MTSKYQNELKEFCLNNPHLVDIKPTKYPEIFILKYKKKVFYDNLWNKFLVNCRGHVVNKDFTLISNPFTKIFNVNIEKDAPKFSDNEMVWAYRKVNGFMIAISKMKSSKELLFSTTGTLDSEYVEMAKELFYKLDKNTIERVTKIVKLNYTVIAEVCHENDPHIIKEEFGIHFLAFRKNYWNGCINYFDSHSSSTYKFNVPEILYIKFSELMKLSKTVTHEGFVFHSEDHSRTAKIKSPHYLVTKVLARSNNLRGMFDKPFVKDIDEEYLPLLNDIETNKEKFLELSEQDRIEYIGDFFVNNFFIEKIGGY